MKSLVYRTRNRSAYIICFLIYKLTSKCSHDLLITAGCGVEIHRVAFSLYTLNADLVDR